MTSATVLSWRAGELELTLHFSADRAVTASIRMMGVRDDATAAHPIVEVFTTSEHRSRAALGYIGSVSGERLRYLDHTQSDAELRVRQRDAVLGLVVETRWRLRGPRGLQVDHLIRNDGARPVALAAVPSLSLATPASARTGRYTLHWGASEWLGESAWQQRPLAELLRDLSLPVHGQDARGRFAVTSRGGWSTGSVLPTGILEDEAGATLTWQIEVTAGWSWELIQLREATALRALGPTDAENQARVVLAPGDEFRTVPAGLAVGRDRDHAVAALTAYRRALRVRRPVDDALPVVYNDYMNTLMGQPSTEALLPLIAHAARAGAEYFCIDAGWFTDETSYWTSIGRWREAPTRFRGGLHSVLDEIRAHGMRPGIWLEPEIVGEDSDIVDEFPADAWMQRDAHPIVEQGRRHLDLRHPAARAHLDDAVDHLVREYGIDYFKLDYNIDPGVGTDLGADPGAGLLAHGRELREWLLAAQERHADVLFENCASGAMRMDYALLSVAHIQSTSDQQDAVTGAVIAATAPLSIAPEQAGNWAYPAAEMSDGEAHVTLVSGLLGRLYLAGHLDRLSDDRFTLVQDAVRLHRQERLRLNRSVPVWPLGIPQWDDDLLALGLVDAGRTLLGVWSRGDGGTVTVPLRGTVRQVFPTTTTWPLQTEDEGFTLTAPAGPDAAVFVIEPEE
ncbi:glycoside hydrolase family 36 protein [Microbacterium sp. NPDC016588]